MELILDASSETVATAIADSGSVIWTGAWLSHNDHTRRLMPEVLRGLAANALSPQDTSAVVVALGPGPFNGLRVAMAAAKGISVATGALLCGIDTLEAEAARCPSSIQDVRPVLKAGKTAYATALYHRTGPAWTALEESCVVTEEALAELAAGTVLCGDIDDALEERLAASSDNQIRVCRSDVPRIATLARLGYSRIEAGGLPPMESVQPLYARPPHITTPRDRR